MNYNYFTIIAKDGEPIRPEQQPTMNTLSIDAGDEPGGLIQAIVAGGATPSTGATPPPAPNTTPMPAMLGMGRQAHTYDRREAMTGFWIRLSVIAAVGLVALGLLLAVFSNGSSAPIAGAHLVSMDESAAAMTTAGELMRAHGQAMLTDGAARNDQILLGHAKHWIGDGDALIQGGAWMAMNPTAPGNLASTPEELAANGNWTALNRATNAMLHDPSNARQVDIEALRWNGEAMRGEGQNMIDHARIMAEEADVMVERHGLQGQAALDLRQAVEVMRQTGGHLKENGQAMMDYADRIRRSMGAR